MMRDGTFTAFQMNDNLLKPLNISCSLKDWHAAAMSCPARIRVVASRAPWELELFDIQQVLKLGG
jgi:hypothetical protein